VPQMWVPVHGPPRRGSAARGGVPPPRGHDASGGRGNPHPAGDDAGGSCRAHPTRRGLARTLGEGPPDPERRQRSTALSPSLSREREAPPLSAHCGGRGGAGCTLRGAIGTPRTTPWRRWPSACPGGCLPPQRPALP
jgi:hypothetical protein